ncbi:MAG: TIGR03086 family metal-binding protein [Acidimicrobiales bacterium]
MTERDPLTLMRRAFDQSATLIESVTPDQMASPTPCTEFDVRTLTGHMLFAANRVATGGRREPIVADGEPVVSGLGDPEWAPAFRRAAADAVLAWAGPGALAGEIVLPFGTFPASVVASIYNLEQVTHAWDLAAATGRLRLLDPELAEAVFPVAVQMLPPEGRDAPELPFDPVVDVPADAPVYDRLAGFMGRDPSLTVGPAR